MVLVAVTLGRWLEANGKLETTQALRDLEQLLPESVRLVSRGGTPQPAPSEQATTIPLAEARRGDLLRVLPGDVLPVDGEIASGEAAIDERMVTGESLPVSKGPGSTVHSGTANLDGELLVRVTAAPGEGTLERLVAAVREAAAAGCRQQRLAERVAGWFLPVVIAVAIAALAFHAWRSDLATGTLTALAVVVIACPCALGLATPMALWAAVGRAARRQILIRDADAFTQLRSTQAFGFDKTGTLTSGCHVRSLCGHGMSEEGLLALAAGLAAGSTHPLSAAITAEASRRGLAPERFEAVRSLAGRGLEAVRQSDGSTVRLGSGSWIAGFLAAGQPADTSARCVVAINDTLAGSIEFAESLRPEAAGVVTAISEAGGSATILSGDQATAAAAIAKPLGMAWEAPLLPEEKLAWIEAHRPTVMVGDGLNDAPALAAADVGVALGCGADVSRWSADLCLLRDDLRDLLWLVDLADQTRSTIRWNLLWAFGYNAAAIPLAAAGIIHPAVAAAAMVVSSLLVVSNSLRLGREATAATSGPAAALDTADPTRPTEMVA